MDWSATENDLGIFSNLTLKKELIPTPAIFRFPKMGALFLSSRLEEDNRDFYSLYRKHRLSGLFFKKLWDEHSGPVANQRLRMARTARSKDRCRRSVGH